MARISTPGGGGTANAVSDSAVATQVTSGTATQAALKAAVDAEGTAKGWGVGQSDVMILPSQMTTGFSAPTGQTWDQRWLQLNDAQANQYGFISFAIPVGWSACSIVVDWATSDAAAGNMDFTVSLSQLSVGQAPSAGSAYNIVAAAAAQDVRVRTVVATNIAVTADLGSVRITRNGTSAADTATGNMHVFAIRLVRSA